MSRASRSSASSSMRRATGDARHGRPGVLRPPAVARDTARSRTADRDRRSAAGRRRAGARAAAAGRLERGRRRSGARAAANGRGCAADRRARPVGLVPEPRRRARRPARALRRRRRETSGRSCIACAPRMPATFQVPPAFAEGMYNRTIVGLSRGRDAGDREAVNVRRLSVRFAGRGAGCDRAVALLRCWPHALARAARPAVDRRLVGRRRAAARDARARRSVPAVGAAVRRFRRRSSRPSC